jgi:hypothetical protein
MITGFAQTTGIGQWRDHQLPYNNCIAVKEVGSRIYCATQYSVFYYDKADNSVQRINKVNGLSDIGISSMNYSPEYPTPWSLLIQQRQCGPHQEQYDY